MVPDCHFPTTAQLSLRLGDELISFAFDEQLLHLA
jgi:hypothetical protein